MHMQTRTPHLRHHHPPFCSIIRVPTYSMQAQSCYQVLSSMWLSAGIRWRLAGVQGELVPCTFNLAPSWTVRQCRSSGIKSTQLAVPEPLRNPNAALRCDEAL